MGKRPCCSKVGLNKGAWTKAEDKILTDYIKVHGEGSWNTLPKLAGLNRCGKSCRLRWVNYLRPDLKRGNISEDEEDLIIRMHNLIGNRWSLIARRLPGRTDNEIKNYWNTTLKKKLGLIYSKMSHKLTKEESPKQALEPKNIVEPSHSQSLLEPIRTKAFRITSKTRKEMTPTNFQYSSGDDEESKDSNREMMVNCQSTVDGALTQEASDLMVDSCEDPQMNDKSIGTSYSPPMLEEHGLEDWFNCSSPINLNELVTSDFEHNLGVLDFWSLATL